MRPSAVIVDGPITNGHVQMAFVEGKQKIEAFATGFWCKSESGWNMMEGMPRLVPVEELFKGRHFDQEIVVLNVRWYVTYKLSYRDLVSMMGERGIDLAHTTILRWVQHYTPEFQKRWNRFARIVGGSVATTVEETGSSLGGANWD